MKFTEKQLRLAAKRVDEKLLTQLPDETACTAHKFSASFERSMESLIKSVEHGQISPAKAAMGWRYYLRNGLAAALLCVMLACLTMPETVMAGYKKLVETIMQVTVEYTEYWYHSNETTHAAFLPATFGYMPDEMEEKQYQETETSMHTVWRSTEHYFRLDQRIITPDTAMTYLVDTENALLETRYIGTEEVKLIFKDGVYTYIWLHDIYHIKGQTNLSSDEIMLILENLKIAS